MTSPSRFLLLAGVGLALGAGLVLRRKAAAASSSRCPLVGKTPRSASRGWTVRRIPSHCREASADSLQGAGVAPGDAAEAKQPAARTRRLVFVDVDSAVLDVPADRVDATLARYGGPLVDGKDYGAEFYTEVLHRPVVLDAVYALLEDPTLDVYFVCACACRNGPRRDGGGERVTNKWRWLCHHFGADAADRLIATNYKALLLATPGALLVSADAALAEHKGVTVPAWNSEEWRRRVHSLPPSAPSAPVCPV